MLALAEELGEPFGRLGDGVGSGDRDDVEARRGGLFVDQFAQLGRLPDGSGRGHQKSRSP